MPQLIESVLNHTNVASLKKGALLALSTLILKFASVISFAFFLFRDSLSVVLTTSKLLDGSAVCLVLVACKVCNMSL